MPIGKIKSNLHFRFGRVEGDPKKSKIFSIVNPVGASKPPSYLQRWDTKTFQLEQKIPFTEGSLSALAVSDNGNFVATGSMFDGTVEIFVAFNLQVSWSTSLSGLISVPCGDVFVSAFLAPQAGP